MASPSAAAAVPDVLALPSVPFPGTEGGPGGAIDSYRLATTTGEELTVVVQAQGVHDAAVAPGCHGRRADAERRPVGRRRRRPDQPLCPGGDVLPRGAGPRRRGHVQLDGHGCTGDQPVPADRGGARSTMVRPSCGRLQRRRPPRPGRRQREDSDTRCRCCWATATARSRPRSPTRSGDAAGSRSWRATSPATADLDLAVANNDRRHGVGAAGQRRRHLPAPGHLRGRVRPRQAIVAGDFTGDGHLDLAVANSGGTTRCRCCWATATAPSSPRSPTRSGSVPTAIVAGDFTGDGQLDLAVANYASDDTVSVLLGNGDGTFQPQVTYAVGTDPDAIVAGDFNGDGHLDLAVANDSSARHDVSVLLGNGDGTFQPQVTYAVGAGPSPSWRATSPATAASTWPSPTSSAGTVSVLLGNGDGTFQPQVTYAVGADPGAIVAGDFTGDGRLDLAVAQPRLNCRRTVSVLLGNGDGTFQPPSGPPGTRSGRTRTPSWRATSTATAASTWPSPTSAATACRCCWATATAPSSPRSPTRSGSDPTAIVAGDFNGDGRLDLAVANYGDDTVSVLLGNGDGTFQPQVTYAVGIGPDRDRGGRLQRRRPARPGRRQHRRTTPCRCCWATATARSSPRSTYAVGDRDPDAIVAGDFNGDGRLDLAVANVRQTARSRCCWATATAPSSPRSPTRSGSDPNGDRGGRLQRRRPTSTWPSPTANLGNTVLGAAGQRRRHLPAPGHLRRGSRPGRDRGGRLQRRRPPRPGRRQLSGGRPRRVGAAGQRRRHLPAPGHLRQSGSGPDAIVAGDFNGDGHLDLAVVNAGIQHRVGAAGQRRRHVRRPRASSPPPRMPRPWWPTSTATAPTMSWSSTAPGRSSIARASPASPAPSCRP